MGTKAIFVIEKKWINGVCMEGGLHLSHGRCHCSGDTELSDVLLDLSDGAK